MAVFLDTSFILAMKYEDDRNHEVAQSLMRRFLKHEFGRIYTSTFVFDELVTLILTRLKNKTVAIEIGKELIKSPRVSVIGLSYQNFLETWNTFLKYADKRLSFTDCSILVTCKSINCNYVATFDAHFKGLIGTNLK